MSATIHFHLEDDAAAPVVRPQHYEPTAGGCLTLCTAREYHGAELKVWASNAQLAAIAKAILAHLEAQEAGDFEKEVA